MNSLLPILTTLVALAASFFMDLALRWIRMYHAKNFLPPVFYLGGLAVTLVFVLILLASAWMVALRNKTPVWVGFLTVAIALLVILFLPIAASGIFPFWENISGQPILRFELLIMEATPNSFLMIQTIALLVSGFFKIIRPNQA